MSSKLTFGEAVDSFLIYLAIERGLSENYQILNRRLLGKLSRGLPSPLLAQEFFELQKKVQRLVCVPA